MVIRVKGLDLKQGLVRILGGANYSITSGGSNLTANRTISWTDPVEHIFTVGFASGSAASTFFANGGQIRLSGDRVGGSINAQNTSWTDLLNDIGTVMFAETDTSSTGTGTGTTIGYTDLTSSYQTVFTGVSAASQYTSDTYLVEALILNSTITFRITYTDTFDNLIDEAVDGTLTSYIDQRKSTGDTSPIYTNITGITDQVAGPTDYIAYLTMDNSTYTAPSTPANPLHSWDADYGINDLGTDPRIITVNNAVTTTPGRTGSLAWTCPTSVDSPIYINSDPTTAQTFTTMLWVKRTENLGPYADSVTLLDVPSAADPSTGQAILQTLAYDGTSRGTYIIVSPTGTIAFVMGDWSTWAIAGYGLLTLEAQDQWMHIALTYDNSTKIAKTYINGAVASGSYRASGYIPHQHPNNATILGRNRAQETAQNIAIDSPKYWDRVLTADEILGEVLNS